MSRRLLLAALVGLLPCVADGVPLPWLVTWAAAPDTAGPAMREVTVRQAVRVSAGGVAVRIRLSNALGAAPLTLGPVSLGRAANGARSQRQVLFGGKSTVTIAKGASALSDALPFRVVPLDELSLSILVNGEIAAPTIHSDARQTAFLGQDGGASTTHRYFITDVLVQARAASIVIVGDSISDGDGSRVDRNARWPDALATRLQRASGAVAVVNSGISGNRLLNDGPVGDSMLQRFKRDALDKEGVRWIVLEAGLNDIGLSGEAGLPGGEVSAAQVIAGLQNLALRARAKGIKVWAATLTPYGGALAPLRHNEGAETKRVAVNAWIRQSRAFDHVLDFDAAIRDPRQPSHIAPAYDSGDHVHPNDAGYGKLAKSVPLGFFLR